jgi:hypothetical protein
MPVAMDGVWKRVRRVLSKPGVLLLRIGDAFKRKPANPEDPDDPFAMVGAPKKPRPPLRHSSIAVEPER